MLTDTCACGASKTKQAKKCRACWSDRGPEHEAPPGEKWCTACKTAHPVDLFRKNTNSRDGLRSTCRKVDRQRNSKWTKSNPDKNTAKVKAWNKSNPEMYQINQVRISAKRLGLDPDDIERRWRAHNGLCDCCGEPPGKKRLAIEHNHATGEFRGFTCNNCNLMIGHARDDPDRLLAGVAYLRAR